MLNDRDWKLKHTPEDGEPRPSRCDGGFYHGLLAHIIRCAVTRRHFSAGANPARQLSCVDASSNCKPILSLLVLRFRDNGAAPQAPRVFR